MKPQKISHATWIENMFDEKQKTIIKNMNETINKIFDEPKGPIEQMFDQKQQTIKESQTNKQNSITEAAIRRDAAMFVCAELHLSEPEELGEMAAEILKEKHQYWLAYFKEMYYGK